MTEVNEKKLSPSIPIPSGPILVDREIDIEQGEKTPETTEIPEVESEGNLPKSSFFTLLISIVKANYKALPKRIMKEAIWLGPLALIWIFVWSINAMTLYRLPGPVRSLTMVVIFLTATYNGFLGKAAFITVMSRTFIPLVKRIRKGEMPAIKEKYIHTLGLLRGIISKNKRYTVKIYLISVGFGLIASNMLTRNNKIDKYLICVLCGVALFDDLSKGKGSPVIRLISAGLRDLPLMIGKRLKGTTQSTWLAVSGFAVGLILSIIPGQFANSFYSPVGYFSGTVLVIAGIVLHFTEGKNAVSKQ